MRATRFLMKGEYPRVEVETPAYRFHAHGRFFGFRLSVPPFDSRITYTDFGSFLLGGIDLVCAHYHLLALRDESGNAVRLGEGVLSLPPDGGAACCRFDYPGAGGCSLGVTYRFAATAPHVWIRFEPAGLADRGELRLDLPGNLVFDRSWQQDAAAGYSSRGTGAGLAVTAAGVGRAAVSDHANGKVITCSIPAGTASEWMLTVSPPAPSRRWPPLGRATPPLRRVRTRDLPVWESEAMAARGWTPQPGRPKERIAGIFVSAENWRMPVSWLPESRIGFIERVFLKKVAAAGCFEAVGMSRDGVTERGENPAWLRLVESAHGHGLRVYMKPGDGELTVMKSRDEIAAWARLCFDVPEARRCDAVRLPGEAVLVPWTTANLCLEPRFITPALGSLHGLGWEAARDRVTAAVADRFSWVIESIRRYAPGIPIDLECCDTRVAGVLLSRHVNLGVMYMAYGQYPRVADYLDLYQCVARRQAGAARTVLETDCYYSHSITGLGQLQGRPYGEMYSPEDVRLMAAKHRHMRSLAAEAVWAWGLNIAYTESRFRAICDAYS
jgi:hypothetical protein